uniref:NADH dehydrogenase subunit 2 n=1 Tax=Hyphydrus ovatus TaxID=159814 RepID=UPI002028826F|nr:NADH dehydrogenase subunit 2 [Hyphydrus ovatus]UPL65084.1 NADH dehydrogenase subunit 2 [Hyphydrus ovatus]
MFNFYKMIFIVSLFMGTMMTISSQSWLGMWMGLEINLLSFIPIIKMNNNSVSSESSIKYFLVQTLASSIFLFSIIMIMMMNKSNNFLNLNNMFSIMMNSSIMMKMGAAPFHFWFPEMIEGLNWMNSLILMTWQKIAPFIILSYIIKHNLFMYLIILISSFIGSMGGLNQISMQKILTYSSINHISWMISAMMINQSIWMMYFMIYSIISMSIILMLNKMKIFFLKQIFNMNYNMYMIKFTMFMNMLSLGGLPPFLGFLPKWMIIQNMSINFLFIILLMILMNLITLFFYIRMMYSSLMINSHEMNFNLKNKMNQNKIMINLTSFISINGLIIYSILLNFY